MSEFFSDYAPSGRAIGGQGLGMIGAFPLYLSGDVAHTMSGRRMKLSNVKAGSRVPHMSDERVGRAKPKAMMHDPVQAMMMSMPTTHGSEDVEMKSKARKTKAEMMKRGIEEMPRPAGGMMYDSDSGSSSDSESDYEGGALHHKFPHPSEMKHLLKAPSHHKMGSAKPMDKRKARGDMIRKLMKEKGMTLPEASRHIKEKGLI